jgi:hypothetical protein
MFRFSVVLVALIGTPVASSAQTLVGTWTLTGYTVEGGPGPYGWVSAGQPPVMLGAMPLGPGGVTVTGLRGYDERPLLIFTEDGLAIAVDPAGSGEAPPEASTVEFSALQLGYASEIVRYQVEGSTLRYVHLIDHASPPSRGRSRESEIVEHDNGRLVTRTTDDTGRTLTMVYLRSRRLP